MSFTTYNASIWCDRLVIDRHNMVQDWSGYPRKNARMKQHRSPRKKWKQHGSRINTDEEMKQFPERDGKHAEDMPTRPELLDTCHNHFFLGQPYPRKQQRGWKRHVIEV
ncbi:predicted protein [Plenodomus lingam JN3]|uniref:Predicted protein n=1 Tax=Leptosphaeria maculans (strain JN3 / isolate v23.1.3 / race Av1-4-5-6-7-8) TaxID=985895 RepID=E5A4J3_LEPMJ|nr:predicted protein [Plenodomus lingam JN3]CBX98541.1 predicted protein [Plenodomus lingam JN3]